MVRGGNYNASISASPFGPRIAEARRYNISMDLCVVCGISGAR